MRNTEPKLTFREVFRPHGIPVWHVDCFHSRSAFTQRLCSVMQTARSLSCSKIVSKIGREDHVIRSGWAIASDPHDCDENRSESILGCPQLSGFVDCKETDSLPCWVRMSSNNTCFLGKNVTESIKLCCQKYGWGHCLMYTEHVEIQQT